MHEKEPPPAGMWRGLPRRAIGRAVHATQRPFHPNPYATHLPILVGLAKLYQVEKVLELGSGPFSTPTFLDRSVFTQLRNLVSIEDDPAWAREIADLTQGDERLELRAIDGTVAEAVSELSLADYDLIFIDDSDRLEKRVQTISAVSARSDARGIVVIHDFDNVEYRRASSAIRNRVVFRAFTPQVGLLWNTSTIHKRDLRRLRARVKEGSGYLDPTDVSRWNELLGRPPVPQARVIG